MATARAPRRPESSRPSAADSPEGRQEQLARILRSETFQQADRLKRFLTFIVTEAIAGRQSDLKEYVIGAQVFRKEESFPYSFLHFGFIFGEVFKAAKQSFGTVTNGKV